MRYVYGCPADKEHPRKDVNHGMQDEPVVTCEVCGERMRRVPQAFRFYMNPFDTLAAKMDREYINYREKKKKGLIR